MFSRGLISVRLNTLLVASTGGHLEQLIRLRPRLGPLAEKVVWATFDTPQSRTRLAGEDVVLMRYTGPRDYANLTRNLGPAIRALGRNDVGRVISTGAGIALAFIPAARARGIECHFIESAARGLGPSFTGRVLARVPSVRTYTQHRAWEGRKWQYVGSVFDGFETVRPAERPTIRRIVVTLGTIGYGFLRLVHRLHEILPPEAEVLWQTGATDVTDLAIDAHAAVPPEQLDQAMRDADAVICHAGIGSALAALDAGRRPLMVPRRPGFDEHVDDHQYEIASDLARRELAITREAEELTFADIVSAASVGIRAAQAPPPILLDA